MIENNIYKKVINASAGTGKTYRLSLEFINLLLSYREIISFDEILVITFTKKATAEIRERIFSHLKEIIDKTEEGRQLWQNLQLINSDLMDDNATMDYLKQVYKAMLTDKQSLKVSTIDSFTNTVFNGLIAPYYNITDYQVDPNINDDYLPELFDAVLNEQVDLDTIFREVKGRNLKSYENLIKTILRYRWVFHFRQTMDSEIQLPAKEELYNQFVAVFDGALQLFQKYLFKYDDMASKPWNKILKKDFLKLWETELDTLENFRDLVFSSISNEQFVLENYEVFLKGESFWNGVSLLRKKDDASTKQELLEILEKASEILAAWMFIEKVIPEQEAIERLANRLFAKYDEIKFRDRIFTYDDISYYTYRYLYDPEISIIDDKNVLNLFYEQLAYNLRFMLIDEFQDTSVLQWNILLPIIAEITSGVGQKPYGGVIIVGDEKQSIYGWRGGERDLLLKSPDFIEMDEEPEVLSRSYRTKRDVMEYINDIFKQDQLHHNLEQQSIKWPYGRVDVPEHNAGGYIRFDLHNRGKVKDVRDKKLDKSEIYRNYIEETILPLWKDGRLNPASTAVLARKNSELETLAQLLEEFGIDYILESSASLFQHKAVKPLLSLYNYLVYNDPYELIRFLRSDLVLMNSDTLKSILVDISVAENRSQFLENWKDNDVIMRIFHLLQELPNKKLPEFIRFSWELFCITDIFPHELDTRNLHHFLEIAADFELNNQDYSCDLSGFLCYIRAIEKKEELSQLSLQESNAIKLLTVHKSKGLEFETLFCVMDATSRGGGFGKDLSAYHQFNPLYNGFAQSVLTYSFKDIVAKSPWGVLMDKQKRQEAVEELNNIYVALTRVKKNLFILMQVDSSKSLEKYVQEIGKKGDPKIGSLLLLTLIENGSEDIDNELYYGYEQGEFINCDVQEAEVAAEREIRGSHLFDIASKSNVVETDPVQWEVLQSSFLTQRNVMKGNIVHHYLSLIEFDEPQVRTRAARITMGEFGTLMNREEISSLIASADKFLDSHNSYFNRDNWDMAFNEKIIFDAKSKEFRIDRMMVSTERKEVLIMDYKTGEHYEESQLENYKKIIASLPIVETDGYKIVTRFLEIEI
jgi:ATP-dependent exoDNAse (exonuclease V) beta subunit